ncbi:uncharacterized protein LOC143664822 isoform X3 [Tamandua tetradactyla]|uniref:uncharacterized protein LOC143664822 isoform X3 n=1 Tax=Tamandua tetradactyla TaxID=48850 RepID=UPI0040537E19
MEPMDVECHKSVDFTSALVQLCDRCILGRSHRTATESHLYPAGSLGFLKDSGGPCSFDGVGALGSPRTLQRLPRSADLPPDGRAHPLPVSGPGLHLRLLQEGIEGHFSSELSISP